MERFIYWRLAAIRAASFLDEVSGGLSQRHTRRRTRNRIVNLGADDARNGASHGDDATWPADSAGLELQSIELASACSDDRTGVDRLVLLALSCRISARLHPGCLGPVFRREHDESAQFRCLQNDAGV